MAIKVSILSPIGASIRYTRTSNFFDLTQYLVIMKKLLTMIAVAGLTVSAANAEELKGDAKAAEAKVAMCIGCHAIPGYRASFPEIYSVPYLGGQNANYIYAALQAYKKGERKHPTMRGIASTLNDQDMADIAAYYSAQTAQTATNKLK